MKKLVIFDLDGTLLDTIGDLAAGVNHALGECGFPLHPQPAYRFMVGNGIMKLFERALPEGEKTTENIARMKELFIPYYDLHDTELTRPYPGIELLLDSLRDAGVAMAVASNKYDRATQRLVAHYFPDVRFTAVLGNREGIPVKPDPTVVHEILSTAGVCASDTLFVGDSGVDMHTAANAGVDAAGVTWGFRPREELEQFAPAHIVDRPDLILRIACGE